MYVYSVILHWGCFIELVAYESSYVNFQDALISLCLSRYVFYVWETSDLFLGTPFPRDSGSLSHPSVHTLLIWLFIMSWFEHINAHSFSFDLFVSLMVFHSPWLHCYFFISIYISCSIFSTHHSYTSHQ